MLADLVDDYGFKSLLGAQVSLCNVGFSFEWVDTDAFSEELGGSEDWRTLFRAAGGETCLGVESEEQPREAALDHVVEFADHVVDAHPLERGALVVVGLPDEADRDQHLRHVVQPPDLVTPAYLRLVLVRDVLRQDLRRPLDRDVLVALQQPDEVARQNSKRFFLGELVAG